MSWRPFTAREFANYITPENYRLLPTRDRIIWLAGRESAFRETQEMLRDIIRNRTFGERIPGRVPTGGPFIDFISMPELDNIEELTAATAQGPRGRATLSTW